MMLRLAQQLAHGGQAPAALAAGLRALSTGGDLKSILAEKIPAQQVCACGRQRGVGGAGRAEEKSCVPEVWPRRRAWRSRARGIGAVGGGGIVLSFGRLPAA
jgi:hypothetical protein